VKAKNVASLLKKLAQFFLPVLKAFFPLNFYCLFCFFFSFFTSLFHLSQNLPLPTSLELLHRLIAAALVVVT
jgi:hypothetical protein